MKIALVHDFLLYWGGAERLLQGLTRIFPEAPIFTLFYNPTFTNTWFGNSTIHHSFLQPLWRIHKVLLPLLPGTMESFNFADYDVVISSGIIAKGIITKPQTRHIYYCHTPTRFLWEESQEYIQKNIPIGLRMLSRGLLHMLRIWDAQAAQRPDVIIANSTWTKQRIAKIYQREAKVVYPFTKLKIKKQKVKTQIKNKKYFLIVSRLQPYKHIDLTINVFNTLKLPLVIAGTGPDEKRLRHMAGSTTEFLGFVHEEELPSLYQCARAVILPGIEDFGLVPIEAMAQGTPVIAYGQGGACETIIPQKTGELFFALTEQALTQCIRSFLSHENQFKKHQLIEHAKTYSFAIFRQKLLSFVDRTYHDAV